MEQGGKNIKLPFIKILKAAIISTVVSILISDFIYYLSTLFTSLSLSKAGLIVSMVIPLIITPVAVISYLQSKYKLEILVNELNQEKSKVEGASRVKDEFLSNMSHELRTPLNHISGFTELLLRDRLTISVDDQVEYLNYILESSKYFLSLISDILDLTKIGTGKFKLSKQQLDIQEFLKFIIKMFTESAEKQKIEINYTIEKASGKLIADKIRVRQVIFNLLSNSLKFTPEGGRIHISVKSEFKGNNKSIHFEIQDTGIGIRKENLERIFSPFEQTEGGKESRHHGTGLGLSISKELIEMHGGRIWAESAGRGKGTTFHIVLPAEPV